MIEFKTIEELYNRILPALKYTKRRMKRKGINKEEKDIFLELSHDWAKRKELSLFDIVSDILNYDIKEK
jgi:hypothetical protein